MPSHSRYLPGLAIWAFAAAAGCTVDRDLDRAGHAFACASDRDCVVGWSCVGGLCVEQTGTATADGSDGTAVSMDASRAGADATDAAVQEVLAGLCDLVTSWGCPPAQACYLDAKVGRICYPAGPGKAGSACSSQADCGVGLTCVVQALDGYACVPLCRTTASASCPPGQDCFALLDAADKPWPDDAGYCK